MFSNACALRILPANQGNTERISSAIGEPGEHVMCVWCISNYDEKALPLASRIVELKYLRSIKERISQGLPCSPTRFSKNQHSKKRLITNGITALQTTDKIHQIATRILNEPTETNNNQRQPTIITFCLT
jgi:hypothetical protein